jgi:hypothetical protein
MKVAILSESSADEAALRVLVDHLLGVATEAVIPRLRDRGWPAVRTVLPVVIKHLYYQTDAVGLVVVADSNHTPPHHAGHEQDGAAVGKCRLCELRGVVVRVRRELRQLDYRDPLHVAIGIAAPAIEGWLINGTDHRVTEAAWARGLRDRHDPYTKPELKKAVYGTERPSLELETRRAVEEATRLCFEGGAGRSRSR